MPIFYENWFFSFWLASLLMFGYIQNRKPRRSKGDFLSVSVRFALALACVISIVVQPIHGQSLLLRTETFDTDPGWDGRNNRATDPGPRTIVQNFGFSSTTNAG